MTETTSLDYRHWRERAESRPARIPVLVMVEGAQPGLIVRLDSGRTAIGRSPACDVQITDSGLSRVHLHIECDPFERCWAEDAGSTNGLWVNGVRVGRHLLEEDDRIQLAQRTVLRFRRVPSDELEALVARYERSIRDELTGAYNRRYFDETLAQDVAYAIRHHEALSVAILDLDFFKAINDRLGHATGDRVLVSVVEHLQRRLRAEDVLARYGGEEFAFLLRGADARVAADLMERLRGMVEALHLTARDGPVGITASIGVAALDPAEPSTAETLLSSADRLMYRAKRLGRNRVEVGPVDDPGRNPARPPAG